ncbi:hypothetical protein GBF38_000629, partial [Nibea albiflora]
IQGSTLIRLASRWHPEKPDMAAFKQVTGLPLKPF